MFLYYCKFCFEIDNVSVLLGKMIDFQVTFYIITAGLPHGYHFPQIYMHNIYTNYN